MGFGFNLFIIFILLPLLTVLFLAWIISKRKIFSKSFIVVCTGVLGLIALSSVLQFFTNKKTLEKDDYGSYVIDKRYFPGRQANWQYDTFRFEIKDNDSIYFYVTDKEKIRQTYKGTISTSKEYRSEILQLCMQQPTYHVVSKNPGIYRSAWSFKLVFNSPKFSNMYFTKGEWETQ